MGEKSSLDSQHMISFLDNFWNQCEEASKLGNTLKVEQPVNGIVFCGMGGSALPGDIIKGYIQVSIPVEVRREYKIPDWTGKNTLVFIVTYSGITEESLSCLKSAKAKGAKIVCICSGGKLKEVCEKTSTPLVVVPKGLQPRASSGYMTIPMLNILINSRLISDKTEEIEDTIKVLKKDIHEGAQGLAQRLVGKVPLIYSSDRMIAVARL
ncbi:MAG: SIS domain-containing protein, partial [Nanoarchaeota archaeon]|nr:SIS domain-containing protein [Nanoarchaeota archaeon]